MSSVRFSLSKNPKVIFVRHGESTSNKTIHDSFEQKVLPGILTEMKLDPGLTSLGIEQSQLTAIHLGNIIKKENAKVHIWQSPLKRTHLTALPFLTIVGAPSSVTTEPLLQEHVGSEMDIPKRLKDVGVVSQTWDEYFTNTRLLVKKIKEKLYSMNDNEYLIIFGHSLTISLAISLMSMGVLSEREIVPVPISFHLPNCSLSIAGINSRDTWDIYHVASISHLGPAHVSGIHTIMGSC